MAVANKNARLATLALTCAAAATAAAIGLHAIIKSHQDQDHLKKVALPAVADIDVSEITNVGIVASAVNVAIAALAFLSLSATALPAFQTLANKTLPLQVGLFAFFLLFEVAAMIPYMVFFANDSAKVTATLQGNPVPEALIKAVQTKLGISGKFKDLSYLKLLAIFPWISIAATIITLVVLFKAWSAVKATPAASSSSDSDLKQSLEHTEKSEA